MSIDGADKSVQKAALFADVALANGAVDHLAYPSGGAVDHEQKKEYTEIAESVQWKHSDLTF